MFDPKESTWGEMRQACIKRFNLKNLISDPCPVSVSGSCVAKKVRDRIPVHNPVYSVSDKLYKVIRNKKWLKS